MSSSSLFRALASTARRTSSSSIILTARRQASTMPRSWTPPQMTFKERFTRFCPPEAYPLCVIVIVMSSFGITWGIRSFGMDPTLRLTPKRLGGKEKEEKPAWEDERALAGKW